jgi:hypothetical protein
MGATVTRNIAIALAAAVSVAACASVLGLRRAGHRPFEHRAHVLQGISCLQCHAGIPSAGDTGPLHLPTTKKCISCHEQPHDARECSNCHGAEFTTHDLLEAREHLRFSHARHQDIVQAGRCVRCHGGVADDASLLRPKMGECLSCHQHKDQFQVRDCEACHVDLPAEMTRPESHMIHEGTFLEEHGSAASAASDLCATCHKQSFCTSCHGQTVPGLPSRMAFDDPMRLGMHRAGFAARHTLEAQAQPGLCFTCHSEQSCSDCHTSQGLAGGTAPNPHPPGWVGLLGANEHGRAARRDPAACAACHSGAGEMLCVSCHAVGGVGGNPHPMGWSSDRSLKELPCRLCHTSPL